MSDDKQKLLQYLQNHDVIVIATCGDRPTACTVYYGADDNFNLYIVTSSNTEHGKNILANGKVAAAITETTQAMYTTKYKIGVQVQGKAKQLTDEEEMKKGLFIWSKKRNDIVEKYLENIKNNIWESRPFIITPKEIKWFNEELYGEEGTEIFRF